jgi:hypothetical protein
VTCPLCSARKGKRACPGKETLICAACCGTKRHVEVRCPADCVYLRGAHAGAWSDEEVARRRDVRRLAPHLRSLTEEQLTRAFLLLGTLAEARHERFLDDDAVAGAIAALRRTAQTREAGLIYEHAAEDPRAQWLVARLDAVFDGEKGDGGLARADDGDRRAVLVALEEALTATRAQRPSPTAFVEAAARAVGDTRPPAGRSSLIVEP